MSVQIGKNVRRLTKDANARIKPHGHVSVEILEILTSFYVLKRIRPESSDAHENLRTMHLVRLLRDDVILRLCKLDDNDTRSWSFEQALKKLRKRSSSGFDEPAVQQQIKEFRNLIKPLREHRDARIAHRTKRDLTFLTPPRLLPAIKLAIEIADALAGCATRYTFLDLDLRADALGT